ncbi:hypothetical protein HNQ80_001180 [Anaerosolibacter carboniphilus]|uniref:Uncharacterized protein n=1 Tax=Anaerosolibacter carboniphilus TaxID=1417629 RepID=A0A841KP70_9FIRM|nr:hypothetical protein [Anaerosolibacter carboniphilus]MBB6215091.1 hypothetical protein [Anaerosolibacter carboniphilus]
MRKVINKKAYDTEKAELVAEFYNGFSRSDFRYLYEGLYKTSKGNYFIHADGGPMSKYHERVGNSTTGLETIIPVDSEEAYEWLEEHNETESIEKYFSDMIQED